MREADIELAGCDLIVELMGGLEPAREYVLRAMRSGRHVVTADLVTVARFTTPWEAHLARTLLESEGIEADAPPIRSRAHSRPCALLSRRRARPEDAHSSKHRPSLQQGRMESRAGAAKRGFCAVNGTAVT